MVIIRELEDGDVDALWAILHEVLEEGDSFPSEADVPKDEALKHWLSPGIATYVACLDRRVVGAYHIKANRPGRGSHVANCGYIVKAQHRGKGIGTAMVEHSLAQARERGYRAMQFNLVVSTNEVAIHVYAKLGFEIVGTLPKAFRHRELGLVDAHVMYRLL